VNRKDHQVFFTALGFLAVLIREGLQEHTALGAMTAARAIEAFCGNALSNASTRNALSAEPLLEAYIAELRDVGPTKLLYDRQTLFKIYELLLIQKTRFEQKALYECAGNDVIADHIRSLAEERIAREAGL